MSVRRDLDDGRGTAVLVPGTCVLITELLIHKPANAHLPIFFSLESVKHTTLLSTFLSITASFFI